MKSFPSLPLLARELTERAAQRRTYVLRVVFAFLLFIPFLFAYISVSHRLNFAGFGAAKWLHFRLVTFQLVGICVFVPATMCGVIAGEKERGTFSLLMLTRLKPWEIILQKYLGGLIPMFSFLLLALPGAGLAYSLGGVSIRDLFNDTIPLFFVMLLVGAISLLASVWCRTTIGAYLACLFAYVLLLGMLPWLMLLIEGSGKRPTPWSAGLISAGITVAALLAAWMLLPRRALVIKRAWPADFTPNLENEGASGTHFPHDCIAPDESEMPLDRPVVWRETTGIGLARPAQILRVAILLECILVPFGLFIALGAPTWVQSVPDFNGMLLLLGFLAVAALTLLGANTFVAERVNQTLDVLLATPLTAREIMSQKASVAYRLLLAGLVPVISLIAIYTGNRIARNPDETAASLIFAVTALGVYLIELPLAWWFALWLSVKSGTRQSATMWALGGVFGLLVLPSFALNTLGGFGEVSPILAVGLVCLSPWETLRMEEGQANRYGSGASLRFPFYESWPLAVTIHLLLFSALLWLLRRHCLRRAESYLRG